MFLQCCRDAYLGMVLSRLNGAVSAAFPGGSRPLPSAADLQKCIGYACASTALESLQCLLRIEPAGFVGPIAL